MKLKSIYNNIFFKVGISILLSTSVFANVTGNSFRDFNGDGVQQAGETGRSGIVVKAYSNTPTGEIEVASTQTIANGTYNLSIANDKYPVRLEYSIPSGLCNLDVLQDFPAANGNTYGTDIQFAKASGEVHNFIFNYPADFSVDANPRVFLPKFGNGDPLVAGTASDVISMTSFHYLDSGHASNSGRGAVDGPAYDEVAKAKQTGSIYGVAYSRQAKKVFASAFLKRHVGMGALGGGGIYIMNPNPPYDTTANLSFMDFDALGIPTSDEINTYTNARTSASVVSFSPVIGSNSDRGLSGNKSSPNIDSAAYSQVGKLSFGDLDISEDGQFLYVVNLYDRKLYEVDLTDPDSPIAPTLTNVSDKVHGYAIPDVCGGDAGEFRPFALKIARGNAYVGITCSGETANGSLTAGSTADMKGSIYKFDLRTHQWSVNSEVEFTFDYRDQDKPWHQWNSTWNSDWEYGEPLISDIEFDGSGNMLIGIMDRTGNKQGHTNYNLDGSATDSVATVGELLRAVRDTASQSCSYNITTNPEFYDDNLKHTESSQGSLAIHRTSIFDGVLSTFMDPIDTWSAGVVLYDNSDGKREQTGYEIFYKDNTPATFGKAGGLGDLEVIEKVPSIEIGNLVWLDSDMDGIQDADEAGIENVKMELLDANGIIVSTTLTDANGGYYFNHTNVGSGNELGPKPHTIYSVRISLEHYNLGEGRGILENKILTKANRYGVGSKDKSDSDADSSKESAVILLQTAGAGENNHNYDFGLIELATIGNYVWYDEDKDGIQDADEDGIEGIKVMLYDALDTLVDTTVTDADGLYLFEKVVPKDYYIKFDIPLGYVITESDKGLDDSIDSDININGKTALTTLDNGENDLSWDVGLYQLSSLGDTIWYDDNKDGLQDNTEKGVSGVKVTLYKSDCSTKISDVVSNNKGTYLFSNLKPDTYCLGFSDLPSSYKISPIDSGGNDSNDSDVNPTTGKTTQIVLSLGENDLSWDMGIYTDKLASLGDTVWYDDNRDGIQDATEHGVEGVKVTLLEACDVAKPLSTTVTDSKGTYIFRELVPATYCVQFSELPSGYKISPQGAGTVSTDSDANPADGKTVVTTLVEGENDLSWDMGIYIDKLASLGDTVWYDDNRDGIQDPTEKGVNGVKVTLLDACDVAKPLSSTVTDAQGKYIFRGLVPADYCVQFSELPSGYKISPTGAGSATTDSDANPADGKTVVTTLVEGENDLSWDMGIYAENLASLGDTVWYDDNRDGIQDATEKGVNGVKVTLLDACDVAKPLSSTVTDAQGNYIFRGLVPATYCVQFTDLPSSYKISPTGAGTATTDSDANPADGKTTVTTLVAGENDLSWDMGIYAENLASLGDTVWYDDNRDGIQDATEKGVNGIKVNLLKNCNSSTVVASSVTDSKGVYLFRDLEPADYCVSFSDLPISYNVSPKNAVGATSQTDSDIDPVSKTSIVTTLIEGENDLSWDMGIYSENLASLGDLVWYDDNRDGIQDPTEKGVNGVKVKLLKDCVDTQVVKETVTDEKGVYLFRDLEPANYCVSFSDLPSSYKISDKNATGSTSTNNSDIDPVTKKSNVTIITEGEHDLSWDMGIYSDDKASFGDTVWYDDNRDGIQDPTEKGVNGVKVKLLKDCLDTQVVKETVTDEKGVYLFRDLVPADYCVSFSDLPNSYMISPKGATGSSVMNDSDIDPTTKKSDITTITEGEHDLTWDMGIYSDEFASIGNAVWYDDNKDGIQDENEKGVNGVKVTLLKDCTTVVRSTVTDERGTYIFRGLVPADYCVEFDELPNGYLISPQDIGDDNFDSDVAPSSQRTALTTLTQGENDLSWDMGIYSNRYAMIGNAVWYDNDRNGIQDKGEKGVEAVKVVLYNASGQVFKETTTDRQGQYQFRNLLVGIYSIGFEDIPVGYVITGKNKGTNFNDSDANPSTGKTVTTQLSVGEADLTWDMGIYSNTLGTIGDAVWYDDNKDGIQDEFEHGVEAVKVKLYINGCTTLYKETTTDRDGVYQFRDLEKGKYCVGFDDLPVSYKISPKNSGDDSKDSDVDPVTKKSDVITLPEGVHNLSIDMGIYRNKIAILGDAVWYDDNRNGIQDTNEQGVEAIKVELYDAGDNLVSATTTDSEGIYQFRDLLPNDYYLRLSDLPVGYEVSPKNEGSNSEKDSDVNLNGKTELITLHSGDVDLSWDMGIFTRQGASIGNHVWYDDNRNGVQDPTESGVEAVKVMLYNGSNQVIASTLTDSRGIYQFRNLEVGAYHIGFSDIPVGYEVTVKDATTNDFKDSDVDSSSMETLVTLLSEGENDLSWDMGIFNRNRASIGDAVWYDDDRDGIQDSDEFGVDAVKVTLYNKSGKKISDTITDAKGNYKFGNLAPNDYYLKFSNLPIGYQATEQDMGSDKKDSDVDAETLKTIITTLEAGEDDLSWDMGIINRQRASIGDSVWYDDNRNGIQDAYEFGVRSVKVTLYRADNTKVSETMTDERGNYAFRNLSVGSYYLLFSDLPSGYEISPLDAGDDTKDSDVDPSTFRTVPVALEAGENDLSWDMGIFNKEKASLGNKVWYDLDHNGIQDIDETGVSAVKITLYNKSGDVVKTTRTNQYGEYIFRDLVPSEYYIGFSEFPAGYMITVHNSGGNDLLDSDANYHRGETILTTLDSGENDLSWDIGLYIPTLGNVDGYVWNDKDRDGIQDSDEVGVPNVEVTIVKNDITQISSEQTTTSTTTVLTDENGHYVFDNIELGEPHEYHLIFDNRTLPTDYSFTQANQGSDDSIDSDVDPITGETPNMILGEAVTLTYDAGIQTLYVSDDTVNANENGPITTISILENDSGNINDETILLVGLEEGTLLYENGTAVGGTTLNTTDTYVVDGEGTWHVESDGTVTFTPEEGFTGVPSPIYYVVAGVSGEQSNIARIQINTPCEPYRTSSVATLSSTSILILLFMISFLGVLLARREFHQEV